MIQDKRKAPWFIEEEKEKASSLEDGILEFNDNGMLQYTTNEATFTYPNGFSIKAKKIPTRYWTVRCFNSSCCQRSYYSNNENERPRACLHCGSKKIAVYERKPSSPPVRKRKKKHKKKKK